MGTGARPGCTYRIKAGRPGPNDAYFRELVEIIFAQSQCCNSPQEDYHRFLHQCPIFERLPVEDGVLLRKYWFSVSDAEQGRRFRARLDDPMRRWKLSSMDLESITRWEDYSRAKDEMFVRTDIPEAPWFVVESEDKRRARINMFAHLLSTICYHEVQRPPLTMPPRPKPQGYVRAPRDMQTYVLDYAATLTTPGRARS